VEILTSGKSYKLGNSKKKVRSWGQSLIKTKETKNFFLSGQKGHSIGNCEGKFLRIPFQMQVSATQKKQNENKCIQLCWENFNISRLKVQNNIIKKGVLTPNKSSSEGQKGGGWQP